MISSSSHFPTHTSRALIRAAAGRECVGRFTEGLAHELNNLVGGIAAMSELLSLPAPPSLSPPSPPPPFFPVATGSGETTTPPAVTPVSGGGALSPGEGPALLHRNAGRLSVLLRHLLALALPPTGERTYVNLSRVLIEYLALLAPALDKKTRVETEVPDAELPVKANEAELRQVVLNLLLGAARATRGLGMVSVRVEVLDPRDDGGPDLFVRPPALLAERARITFRDTAPRLEPPLLALLAAKEPSTPFTASSPRSEDDFSASPRLLSLLDARGFAAELGGGFGVRAIPGGNEVSLILPLVQFDSD